MPKEEWGVKRICPTTGQRFYDLKKNPIVSPYTGERVVLDANTRTRVAAVEKTSSKEDADDLEDNVDLLDDSDDDGATDSDVGDELLDDDDDDTVSLDEIADVPADSDET